MTMILPRSIRRSAVTFLLAVSVPLVFACGDDESSGSGDTDSTTSSTTTSGSTSSSSGDTTGGGSTGGGDSSSSETTSGGTSSSGTSSTGTTGTGSTSTDTTTPTETGTTTPTETGTGTTTPTETGTGTTTPTETGTGTTSTTGGICGEGSVVDTTFTVDSDECNHRGFIGLSSDDVTVAISRAPDMVTISGTHQSVPTGATGAIDQACEFVDICGMANPAGYAAECCWTGGWDGSGWTVGTLFCCGVNGELPGGCPICWLASY